MQRDIDVFGLELGCVILRHVSTGTSTSASSRSCLYKIDDWDEKVYLNHMGTKKYSQYTPTNLHEYGCN